MTAPPGSTPNPRGSVRPDQPTTRTYWPPPDIAAAAFHMHSIGMTESMTAVALRALEARGVRNLRTYVMPWTEVDAARWAGKYQQIEQDAARAGAAVDLRRHHDAMVRGLRRRATRWPWGTTGSPSWRVST